MFPLPDSSGNVSPQMKPVRHLAWVACGYIMWQNSTEDTWYKMAQIQTVKQVVRHLSLSPHSILLPYRWHFCKLLFVIFQAGQSLRYL